jgi:hypothetical protein
MLAACAVRINPGDAKGEAVVVDDDIPHADHPDRASRRARRYAAEIGREISRVSNAHAVQAFGEDAVGRACRQRDVALANDGCYAEDAAA